MRGRNKPWANDFIRENNAYIFNKDKDFLDNKPIYLEVGMGKGDFIIECSKYYHNANLLGVELNKSVFALALKKIVQEDISNLKILNAPAANLLNELKEHSVDKIFLNFSDPWPKSGHKKRRLVHPIHLEIFEKLLSKDGEILFKTDNLKLFQYGLEVFVERNYDLKFLSFDYQLVEGDFMSEYEKRFRSLNQPIYRCVFKIKKGE